MMMIKSIQTKRNIQRKILLVRKMAKLFDRKGFERKPPPIRNYFDLQNLCSQ